MRIDRVKNGYMFYKTVNGKTQQLLLDTSDVFQFLEVIIRDMKVSNEYFEKMGLDVD